jgi:antitoxin component of MazEF toxin-antitoxin module
MIAKVRKAGNSLAVTIPRDEAERLGISDGDMVNVELNKVRIQVEMRPHVRSAFDEVLREHAAGLEYLADK